jgi:hypothetical protein
LSGYWQTDFGSRTLGLVAVPRPGSPQLIFGPYVPGVE